MNYKVMQRPMFKMGGKAASQGTGITSGLDQKANYSIGGGVIKGQNMNGRENFQEPEVDYSSMSIKDLLDLQQANQSKQMSGLSDMRDIIKLQALGNLTANVLPNVESKGLSAVTDFFKDPMTTQAALSGLTGLKKVDLKEKQLQGEGLNKYITGRMGLEQLDISREKANQKTATELKNDFALKAEALKVDGVVPPEKVGEYERLMKISLGSGFMTQQEAKKFATAQVLSMDPSENPKLLTEKGRKELIEEIASSLYYFQEPESNAEGGRVGRQMGSPMGGEQPMQQGMGMEQQDVAMETQNNQGNKVYDMLRARLPQEVSDEVVKLISYNKEAFGDFASIKNQEDVNSFNEKYGVQLVIDVATI
jgi:hypothetical protein